MWVYEQITSHFTFRKLTSTPRHSISDAIYEIFRRLEGTSSLIQTSSTHLSLVLSKRYGEVKPCITNWPVGKDLSNFVSVTIRISTFPITASARSSNLFRTEFILMCDVTIRFKFTVFISFSFVLKSSLVACYSGNRH